MGVFEFEKFAKGTNDVATTLAECTAKVRADSLSADMLLWPVSFQTHFVLLLSALGPQPLSRAFPRNHSSDQHWMFCTAR